MSTGAGLLPNEGANWGARALGFVAVLPLASFVVWLLLWYSMGRPNRMSAVEFAHRVDNAMMMAALVLPAWVVWRLPHYYLSIPIGTLISWGLMVIDGWLISSIDLHYDSIAPGLMVFCGGPLGGSYCLIVAAVCEVISPLRKRRRQASHSPPADRIHSVIGFAIWTVVTLFCFLLPFVNPPLERRGDPTFPQDYFGACWPILLLVVTMVLMYAVSLLRTWLRRQSEQLSL